MNTLCLLQHARVSLPWARARIRVARPLQARSLRSLLGLDPCRLPVPVPIPARRPRPTFPRVLFAALALTLAAPAAFAAREGMDWTADGRLVDVQVLVDNGQAPLYFRGSDNDRWYFQAFRGRNYALRLHNNSAGRIGVLMAVDGLNVVNGERSTLSRHEPMYVLDPWETTVIRGWRTSLNDVRRFVFVDEERSYAERTGQANRDMGWIRVLAFEERRTPVIRYRNEDRDDRSGDGREIKPQAGERREAAPAPSSEGIHKGDADMYRGAPQAESYPGTGWGDRRRDPVRETWFDPAPRAADRLAFRYEYASGLRALGFDLRRWRLGEREEGQFGFARPPRR